MHAYFLFIILLLLPYLSMAQRYHPTGVEARELIAVGAGTTSYYGDIDGTAAFPDGSPHIALTYEYRFLSHLGLRAAGSWYRLAASDAQSSKPDLQDRNLTFHSSNWELSLQAAAYLFPLEPTLWWQRKKLNAYALIGLGITAYNPKADYQGQAWELRSMQTEGVAYGRTAIVVPFGAGLQIRLSPQLDAALQLSYHRSFTDYLDDVSTQYQDQELFDNPTAVALADRKPEIGLSPAQAGAIRGNPEVADSYAMLSLRTVYYLKRYHYRGKEIKRLYQ